MQGRDSVEERLRFEWTPEYYWKERPDGEPKAVLLGWKRTVELYRNQTITETWCYAWYYHRPLNQVKGHSFEKWLEEIDIISEPTLKGDLYRWTVEKFRQEPFNIVNELRAPNY